MPLPLAIMLARTWDIAESEARDWLAIAPAIKDSVDSQLPGRENGPADAYRHLLWGAELTRKFGPDTARKILDTHEIQGDLSTRMGLDSQSPAAAAMDRHNNEIAVTIGRIARTWADVEQAAREVMDSSDRSGNGANGGAVWLPESAWESHPKDDTGKELPPEGWNWPETNWEAGSVDSDPSYRYPYGGEEHRHEPAVDDGLPLRPGEGVEVNPLSRPVASWSEDDLRRVMASPAYLQPNHPGRARAQAMVRDWFERAETSATRRVDATGRSVREPRAAAAPASGACEVPVRGHSRQGGKVEVDAHCRSRPAA